MPSNVPGRGPSTNQFATTAASEREVQRRRARGQTAQQVADERASIRVRDTMLTNPRPVLDSWGDIYRNANWTVSNPITNGNSAQRAIPRMEWGPKDEEKFIAAHEVHASVMIDLHTFEHLKVRGEVEKYARHQLAKHIADEIVDRMQFTITPGRGTYAVEVRVDAVVMEPSVARGVWRSLKQSCMTMLEEMWRKTSQ